MGTVKDESNKGADQFGAQRMVYDLCVFYKQ